MTARAETGPGSCDAARRVFRLAAEDRAVRTALMAMRRFMAGAGLGADACGTAEIVLAEALNNIAEHAYAANGTGEIRVTLCVAADRLTAEIVDHGAALPGLRLPDTALPCPGPALSCLPEGGFGWFLIRSLTRCLRYDRRGRENRLLLCVIPTPHPDNTGVTPG